MILQIDARVIAGICYCTGFQSGETVPDGERYIVRQVGRVDKGVQAGKVME